MDTKQAEVDKLLAELRTERQKIFVLLRAIEDHHRWVQLLRRVLVVLCIAVLVSIFF